MQAVPPPPLLLVLLLFFCFSLLLSVCLLPAGVCLLFKLPYIAGLKSVCLSV